MDKFEHARQLREEYESALDDAEKRRADYHREILKLHRSGMPLRGIAEQLGISHQRVHQIVGLAQEPRRRGRATAGGVTGALIIAGLVAGWAAFNSSPVLPPRARLSTGPPAPAWACYAEFPGSTSGSTFNPLTMAAAVERCSSSSDAVVVLNPNTGQILALIAGNHRSRARPSG